MNKESGSLNIQDSYLDRARRERAWLTVFLNSGKKITGRIRSFDRYTLIVEDRGAEQMIFKHAIATISTSRTFSNPINFGAPARGSEGGGGDEPGAGRPAGKGSRPGGSQNAGEDAASGDGGP